MKVIQAPNKYPKSNLLFLAGSIEMGKAEDWQKKFIRLFNPIDKWTILNPRRDDWDSSWEQKYSNDKFREQVEWELQAMEDADYIAMYFSPGTKSPITLLELGLFARSEKLSVCCPGGFWKQGNVDVVCDLYGVPMAVTLEQLIEHIERLQMVRGR